MTEHEWKDKLKALPEAPGVYLMKDVRGDVIYIGKAVVLKNRVRSYFQDAARLAPKVAAMMRHVADLEVIVTETEVEALILEATLVKQQKPRYNIRLKDDKAYPYLRLTWEDRFPRLIVARRPATDGSRYFGPFPHAQAVRDTIRLLRRVFPIRNCTNQKFANATRPCLEYHIQRCQAPCQSLVDQASYRAMMKDVERFLEGRTEDVERDLMAQMTAAAEALEFERAAQLRNQLLAVREITQQQRVAPKAGRELDAIQWAVLDDEAFVQVFHVRGGRLTGRESLTLTGVDGAAPEEIGRAFLFQYYGAQTDIPQEILWPVDSADRGDLMQWLKARRGGPVSLVTPKRGEKARLLELVGKNAEVTRDEVARRGQVNEKMQEEALWELKEALGLSRLPVRMECYDISNTQGSESVASMVVFTHGKPDKSQYRRFKIQTVSGPNDFLSMYEVIGRRFRHQELAEGVPQWKRFAERPDLVIIDGGRGQLGYAVRAMQEAGVGDIAVFGLAKEHEWLYQPDDPQPIILPRDSLGLKLLQHLRDEAHRFAITFHRKLRTDRNLRSVLDEVPGIGPQRKRALLQAYGDVYALRRASVEELRQVPGMTLQAAETLSAYLRQSLPSTVQADQDRRPVLEGREPLA